MRVVYRQLSSHDWQQFHKIRLIFLKNEPQAAFTTYKIARQKSQQELINDIEHNDSIFWGAFQQDEIVSIAGARKENDKWILKSIYTIEEARGNKLMQNLIKLLLNALSQLDSKLEIYLRVTVTQFAAISIYQKLGFSVIETTHDEKLGDGKLYSMHTMKYLYPINYHNTE